MTIRAGKINGKNLNYIDQDNSALDYALVNSGIIEWFEVTAWQVAIGRAILITKRTSVTPNQKFWMHIEITAPETIDTTGTKKVWIEVDPQYINDGTLATNPMGTQIAKINTGASYPSDSAYYIPLASITSGTITDARVSLSGKPILQKWYGLNKHKRINRASGDEEIKNVSDWSTIISTDKLRVEKSGWDYEDIPFAVFSSILSPNSLVWNPNAVIAQDLSINDAVVLQDIPTSSETQLWWQNVGDVVGNSIITMYWYSTGVSSNTLKLRTDKVSPTQNFAVRIVTTSGWVATTTQVDVNAIQSIAPASVTAGGELTITFPWSFSCGTRGTKIAIQVCQGTFASPVTGWNYYKVWYGIGSPVSSNSSDLTSTCSIGTYQWGMTSVWNFSFTTNRVIKLKTIVSEVSVPSGTTITITVWGSQALQFVTSGSSATITIPNWWLLLWSGKSVVVSTSSWNASSYHTMWALTDANITTSSQNTPFYIVTSTGYAEYNMTSTLVENITAQKSICALLSTRHRLVWFTSWLWVVSNVTSTLSREWVLGWFSGLTIDSTYYLSDTAWLISLISSSISQKVWVSLSSTELDIKIRYTF